jgi:predicted nucleotidyltransferase
MLSQEEIEEIVSKIVATYGPDKILVFGSYAKGNPTDRSDLDLLVIKDSELPQQLRGQNVRRLFYGSPVPIELQFYSTEEIEDQTRQQFSFLSRIVKSGKELYSRR